MSNFKVKGESGDEHVRFQPNLKKSFCENIFHFILFTSWTLGGGRAIARPMKPIIGAEDFWNEKDMNFVSPLNSEDKIQCNVLILKQYYHILGRESVL